MTMLALLAIHAVDSLLCIYRLFAYKYRLIADITWVLPISIVQYMILGYSATWELFILFVENGGVTVVINGVLILVFNILIVLIIRSIKGALILSTALVCVYSIANYYVIKFHGSPLYPSELINIKTAEDVVLSYDYEITRVIIIILILSVICTFAIIRLVPSGKTKRLGIVSFLIISILVGVTGITFLKPSAKAWAPWRYRILANGYVVESIIDIYKWKNPFYKPEGYNEDAFKRFQKKVDKSNLEKLPDIILILNESFYDLTYSVDVETDVDCLELFKNIEGAVYGYAVAPNIGGGTNDSEFELLTSKSRSILRNSAPFTYIENGLLERSIVNYLKDGFGYETTGLHCGNPDNYSRNTAYPNLKFDHIYLGENCFSFGSYGNRKWLDSDNYHDLIKHYEECGDNPRMMFLLTYQNHGGYQQNDSSYDTIHVKSDYGKLTDDINEYLSSVELSSKAFRELTEYFRKCGRDVVICMVDDHAPSFISELSLNNSGTIESSDISKHMVPYVIWSNFNIDTSFYTEYATMTDLVPMTLKAANIPLSEFYKTVLELHEAVPIRTKERTYIDREYNIGVYGEEDVYRELLDRYYYMEYNSLLSDKEYQKELFMVN